MECPICLDRPPSESLNCGHAFCGRCITEWEKKDGTCPFCRKVIRRNEPQLKTCCPLCRARMKAETLQSHLRRVHYERICLCGFVSHVSREFRLHLNTNCPFMLVSCPLQCGSVMCLQDCTDDPFLLFRHHRCKSVWKCEACKEYFISGDELGGHINAKH